MSKYFKHQLAFCETDKVGEKTNIWAFAHVMKGAKLGKECNICDHSYIESKCVLGDKVTVKNGAFLCDGVIVEDNVFLGPYMTFTNDINPRSKAHDYEQVETLVKKGATIGANSTIIGGITIGEYSMIGAGSVVTKNVGDHWLVFGNPAVLKGYVCRCGEKLVFDKEFSECNCGLKYSKKNEEIKLLN